ncbi:MAG: hypothetical protein ABIR04_11305 [Cypionkella sp.]
MAAIAGRKSLRRSTLFARTRLLTQPDHAATAVRTIDLREQCPRRGQRVQILPLRLNQTRPVAVHSQSNLVQGDASFTQAKLWSDGDQVLPACRALYRACLSHSKRASWASLLVQKFRALHLQLMIWATVTHGETTGSKPLLTDALGKSSDGNDRYGSVLIHFGLRK